MDIVQKHWNAYKLTYMGDSEIKVTYITMNRDNPIYITKDSSALFFSIFPTDKLDDLVYEKVFFSGYLPSHA